MITQSAESSPSFSSFSPQKNDSRDAARVMILIIFYFISPYILSPFIIQFLLFQYESIKLFFLARFYRLPEISFFLSFFSEHQRDGMKWAKRRTKNVGEDKIFYTFIAVNLHKFMRQKSVEADGREVCE